MRIAIVNDSLMAVESLRRVITSAPQYKLAWIANDGAQAVRMCAKELPDLILMDLLMPVMDGVQATRKIMAETPCPILIVTATVTGNSSKVFEAMGAGALDAVNTPILGAGGDGDGHAALLQKIRTVESLIKGGKYAKKTPPKSASQCVASAGGHLIAIGASTGGPTALASILKQLPKDFPAAVAIVQHVDEQFAPGLAEWLGTQIKLPVRLANEGDRLYRGTVLIAGREDHMVLTKDGTIKYTPEPKDYVYRPSVNAFFDSIAEHWTQEALGVLLTGMGRDGADGLLAMRTKGCHTIAQDQASCAVYGMPKAAAAINAAAEILPLDEIGAALTWYVGGEQRRVNKERVPS